MSVYIENFETIVGVKNNIQALRNKVLELAIQGKLVEQDPNDEPASELVKKIQVERDKLVKEGKIKKQKSLDPISEDEIPFELPDYWQWGKLGDLGQVIGGGTPKSEVNEYWKDGIIPWITPADLSNDRNKFISRGRRNITELGLKESSAILIPEGTVLFSSRAPIGHIAISSNEISTNQGFKSIVPYIRGMNEYIYYFMKWDTPRINESASGTTFKEVSGTIVSEILIPIPPLGEQHRIVTKIESLMSEIEKLEESLQKKEHLMELLPKAIVDAIGSCQTGEELKEQLQFVIENFEAVFQTPKSMQELRNVVLQLAIEGKLVPQDSADEPASDLVKRIQVERAKLVKEGKIKKQQPLSKIEEDEIPFEIPECWEWVRLDEICKYIQRGKSPIYSAVEKYPVIAQKCIQWSGISLEKALFIEPASIGKYTGERFLLHGDVLWNSTGTGSCGRVGKFTDSIRNGFKEIVADSHVTVVRCLKQYINYDYLFIWLKSPEVQSVIESKASGSTNQIELATSTIKRYLISMPPLEEQHRIVQKVESIMSIIDQMENLLKRKFDLVEKMAGT